MTESPASPFGQSVSVRSIAAAALVLAAAAAAAATGRDEHDQRRQRERSPHALGLAEKPGTRNASRFAREISQPFRIPSTVQMRLPLCVPTISACCGPPY